MITASDPYYGVCRIGRDRFAYLLRELAAPSVVAERDPEEYWDLIWLNYRSDPLFLLALFNVSSSMGKENMPAGKSPDGRHHRPTHSWGNTLAPYFGPAPIATIRDIDGVPHPVYFDWKEGCASTAARLTTHLFFFRGEERDIGQVFEDPFQREPAIDWFYGHNVPDAGAYLDEVLAFMNFHADDGEENIPEPDCPLLLSSANGDQFQFPSKGPASLSALLEAGYVVKV